MASLLCGVVLLSTAGTDRVATGLLADRTTTGTLPPASVTEPELAPPVTALARAGASTTRVEAAAHAAGAEAPVMADVLLAAYQLAASVAPAGCHLPVTLLAAIGQVESGNLRGRRLDAGKRVTPRLLGPVLDGKHFSAIRDTDGGVLDGNKRWDRALGPLQFIPSTWARFSVDLDGDGVTDPQDVEDAAGAAALYLCWGDRDLAQPADLSAAILSYNHSRSYLAAVLAWKAAYDDSGLTASLPMDLTQTLEVRIPTRIAMPTRGAGPVGTTAGGGHGKSGTTGTTGSTGTRAGITASAPGDSTATPEGPAGSGTTSPLPGKPGPAKPPTCTPAPQPTVTPTPTGSPAPSSTTSPEPSPQPAPSTSSDPTAVPSDPAPPTCPADAPAGPAAPGSSGSGTTPSTEPTKAPAP
jgi:transglycosylase-like protein with SLT domain